MIRSALMASLLMIAIGSATAAEKIYKWTDAQGVVHFSKTPPANGKAQSLKLRSAPPAPVAAEAPEPAPTGELYAEAEAPDNSKIEAENKARQCTKGRAMIAQIEPRPRVYKVAEDGTRTYLDDDERQNLLAEARDLVRDNCDS